MALFSSLFSLFVFISPFVFARPMFGDPAKIWSKGQRFGSSTYLEKRAGPGPGPQWVAYWDSWVADGPPDPSALKGFNVLILAFLMSTGPADQVAEWTCLDAATRSSIKTQYAAAGIRLMISAFGATDAPTSSGYDPVLLANAMASFVKTWDLDGIDVDYEDMNAMNAQDGRAEQWLIRFTQTLRVALPAGQYIITHAPLAPWFSPIYPSGAYRKIHSSVGNLIDWYNVQFYNQDEYTTCAGLLTTSSSTFPNSAVFQINTSAGVPLNKIVIGKPGIASDADNGYMTPATLAGCLATAKSRGWNAGAMVWEYPHATSAWITSVRALSWPVSGALPSTTVKVSSSTSSTSTSSTSTSSTSTSSTSSSSTSSSSTSNPGGPSSAAGTSSTSSTKVSTSTTTSTSTKVITPKAASTTSQVAITTSQVAITTSQVAITTSQSTTITTKVTTATATTKAATTTKAVTSTTKATTTSTKITTSSTKVTTTSTTAKPTTSTRVASGACANTAAWSSTVIYTNGRASVYSGSLWTAKWWTQGDAPGTNPDHWSDPWAKGVAC